MYDTPNNTQYAIAFEVTAPNININNKCLLFPLLEYFIINVIKHIAVANGSA